MVQFPTAAAHEPPSRATTNKADKAALRNGTAADASACCATAESRLPRQCAARHGRGAQESVNANPHSGNGSQQNVNGSPPATAARPIVLRPSDEADLERLGDEIAELAAHVHAATYQLLVRLREFDVRSGWSGGFKSCAHWLSWRTGIAPGAAREKVRVARALEPLPALSDAMRKGELSYAKIRAATRVATPENEAQLLELARHGTAAHVEKVVRAWRRVDRLEELHAEGERHRRRQLTLYIDEDGSYVIRGRLDPEVGALLERALDAAEVALYRKPGASAPSRDGCGGGKWRQPVAETEPKDGMEPECPVQRRADALALVAEYALRSEFASVELRQTDRYSARPAGCSVPVDAEAARASQKAAPPVGRADRFQVVVHVDAEALKESSETGQSVLGDGIRVPAETSRRLACDANRVVMVHDANGAVLDVGRRTRTVPPAIRRALDHRDRGCRFPGCSSRFCDAHHIVHWADGGKTRLDNLILLCRRHHRAVHEEGYRLTVTEAGELNILRPNLRPLPHTPAAPPIPDDAIEALKRSHSEMGLDIDAWTPTPLWQGERLDLDFAVTAFRRISAG